MKKSKLLLLLLSIAFFTAIQAQTNRVRVTGTVADSKGEVLIGVSVFETGTTVGTVTDVNGAYSIDVSSPNATLTYSFIGFTNQVVVVGNQTTINVKLEEDNKVLDEIVAVGYGVQRRKDVTGAVVSMKPDDLSQMPQTNVVQSLQGKVAGMSVVNQGASAEGDQLKLRIRAQKSISADAQPLIILDGIPYSGFLSEISPNDIESIEVLKDASSAAVYGARAANGVLLITTKKGKSGKMALSFNGYVGMDRYSNMPDMMTGEEFYNFKKERLGFASSFETQQYEAGINTDWIDLASRTGRRQDYNLAVSGGKDGTNYFISGNVSNIKGIAINDDYNRYTIRQNIETQLTDWLKLGTNTQLGYFGRNGDRANFYAAMRMSPLTNPYNADGSINFHPWADDLNVTNPLEPLNRQNEDVSRSVVTNNFLQIDFPFVPGLSYRLNGGYNYRYRLIESYSAMSNTLEGEQKGGVAGVQNQGKEDWTLEQILTYTRSINKHNFTLTGMYSSQQFIQKFHNNEGVGFPGDYMTYYQFKLATTLTPSDDYKKTSNLSQMLRLNYSFDSRYLLTLTARRDGYSAFGANSKFGIFPSAALGWNVEQESFMQQTQHWLDRLKLRLSYGENGNQAIDAYTALPTMSNEYYLDDNKAPLIGFYSNKLADPTLSWETTRQFNVGVDYSFFRGRISGAVDAYMANTYDLLLNKQIPQINGVGSIRQNVGETQSSGFEFQLSSVNLKRGDFTWSTDFNIAFSKNEIVNVGLFDENGKPKDNLGSRWFIGKPINVVYSYVFDGIWQESDDIVSSHMPTAKPGDVKVKDISGPDGVPDNKITSDDMKVIGHGDPDYVAGMMNSFSYKGVTLSFFINAVHGVTRYTEYMNTYFDGKTNIRKREWWTPQKPINNYPANRDDSNPFGLNYFGKENDASYIRLSDITLAYQFPKPLLKKMGVSNLEVFANAKNLYTLTNYIGLDPEYTSDYSVPQTQSFIFGVKFGL